MRKVSNSRATIRQTAGILGAALVALTILVPGQAVARIHPVDKAQCISRKALGHVRNTLDRVRDRLHDHGKK